MKFITPLIALLAAVATAVDVQKAVIISYPDETPTSVMDEAKDAIRKAGGLITHEYNIFKGFAAKVPEKTLETVSALSSQWQATIEEDQVVSINS